MSHGVAKHSVASAPASVLAVGEPGPSEVVGNCLAGTGLAFGGLLEQA